MRYLSVLAALLLTGLTSLRLVAAEVPLIVTSSTILQDAVRQLTGEAVRIHCLVPPGTHSLDYEPSSADLDLVRSARLVVITGVDREPWIEDLVRATGYSSELVVAADGMTLLDSRGFLLDPDDVQDRDPFDTDSVLDPHFWHNPRNVIHFIRMLSYSLEDVVPSLAGEIGTRMQAQVRELEEMHTYAVARFATLPPASRRIVTSHDSLNYLAHTYGFTIERIPGFEPGRTPQPAQIAHVNSLINVRQSSAVFFAAGLNSLVQRQIAAETGVRIITSLFTETLDPGDTYAAAFKRNIDTIVEALK